MTTLVKLRGARLQRSKPEPQRGCEEFRDDVVTYGGVLYESLRLRRDFHVAAPSEHRETRRHRSTDQND